nr:hypothetical protein [Streptomyces sp. SAT1]
MRLILAQRTSAPRRTAGTRTAGRLAGAEEFRDGLRPAGHPELPVDRVEIVFDSTLGYAEIASDLPVRHSGQKESEDLALPLGEGVLDFFATVFVPAWGTGGSTRLWN